MRLKYKGDLVGGLFGGGDCEFCKDNGGWLLGKYWYSFQDGVTDSKPIIDSLKIKFTQSMLFSKKTSLVICSCCYGVIFELIKNDDERDDNLMIFYNVLYKVAKYKSEQYRVYNFLLEYRTGGEIKKQFKELLMDKRALIWKKNERDNNAKRKQIESENKRYNELVYKIIRLLTNKNKKLPVSDIAAFLKHNNVDEIKSICKSLYKRNKISYAGNGRYFILTDESEKKEENHKNTASDPIEEVRKYAKLRDDGLITEKEYQAKKKDLLGIPASPKSVAKSTGINVLELKSTQVSSEPVKKDKIEDQPSAENQVKDSAEVDSAGQTFTIKRFKNNSIKVFQKDGTLMAGSVKTFLVDIIKQYDLPVEYENKNTRMVGKKVIEFLNK